MRIELLTYCFEIHGVCDFIKIVIDQAIKFVRINWFVEYVASFFVPESFQNSVS